VLALLQCCVLFSPRLLHSVLIHSTACSCGGDILAATTARPSLKEHFYVRSDPRGPKSTFYK
jgi:hypothetical protein